MNKRAVQKRIIAPALVLLFVLLLFYLVFIFSRTQLVQQLENVAYLRLREGRCMSVGYELKKFNCEKISLLITNNGIPINEIYVKYLNESSAFVEKINATIQEYSSKEIFLGYKNTKIYTQIEVYPIIEFMKRKAICELQNKRIEVKC